MPNELYHYGTPQTGDGKGSGRYRKGSGKHPFQHEATKPIYMNKGSKVYRYSSVAETGSLNGVYVFKTPTDRREYFIDSKECRLGFKRYDKLYMTEITLNDNAVVRRGRDTVKDMLDKIGDAKLQDAYKRLDEIGFWDDKKGTDDRWNLIDTNANKEQLQEDRAKIASSMNTALFDKSSKDNRKKILDEYRSKGYDAIVDPEDFAWTYERPMIITNEDKFSRTRTGVVYDKTSEQHFEDTKDVGKAYYYLSNEDKKRLEDFIKNKKKKG